MRRGRDVAVAHGTLTLNARRQLHLHAGGELQRRRQLHLHGDRRHGATRNAATVTITVDAVNDAPVAANEAATTDEDTPLDGATCLANDTTTIGDPLTLTRSRRPSGARHADASTPTALHLHAGRELQRRRQLHLHGDDGTGDSQHGDGVDHGRRGQRSRRWRIADQRRRTRTRRAVAVDVLAERHRRRRRHAH